jgi:hypothetical protein
MLDNERYRYLNISVFTCIALNAWTIINQPASTMKPNFHNSLDNINVILVRLVSTLYLLVFYAPIVMGVGQGLENRKTMK